MAYLNHYKKQQKKSKTTIITSFLQIEKPIYFPNPMSDTTTANIQEPVEKSSDKKKKKPSSWSIILKHFRELKLPLPSAPETWLDFSALGELLYEPKVIVVTTKILNTALKQKDDNSRHRARVFLTSYVMLMCPNEILSLENEDEKVYFFIKKKGGDTLVIKILRLFLLMSTEIIRLRPTYASLIRNLAECARSSWSDGSKTWIC